ncbi:MAG: class II aldolase/adducin family protein [Candidatus Cloacimonetes bacterium]|nr:class II aldolase/adducin family protein [Candidatus Cloacimonadota bacterium]
MHINNLKHPIFKNALQHIAEISRLIHSYGWAEANAGNISMDVSDLVMQCMHTELKWYIVSRTGSRYRQTALSPCENLMLVACSQTEDTFFPQNALPTSEWISHRCLQMQNDRFKIILHTHPAEIIALSNLTLAKDSASLNAKLCESLPELPLYLPEGVALVPRAAPGSLALCTASIKALKNQKALIWSGHGILAFANELDEALDYLEIVTKAAKILLWNLK